MHYVSKMLGRSPTRERRIKGLFGTGQRDQEVLAVWELYRNLLILMCLAMTNDTEQSP
jgi:hypothetical protein